MSESSLPLVTVIVPCYNHEKYVETCLDSIFRQTYKNIEVIVVDDCSPDNSAEVIKKLQQKYDFKFIEHTENWGLTRSLNDVIYNHAQGKYIKCIASDDYLTDDCVEVLTTEIERLSNEYAFVYAQAQHFVYEKGNQQKNLHVGGWDCSFMELYLQKKNYIPAMTVLFSRDKFIELDGFDHCYIEDYYMWLTFALEYKYKFIGKVVAYYQLVIGTSMHHNVVKMGSGLNYIQSKIFLNNKSQIAPSLYFELIKQNTISFYRNSIINDLYAGNNRKALVSYFRRFMLFLYNKDRILWQMPIRLLMPRKTIVGIKYFLNRIKK
ncbi:MAG: glycosyltransferase family 2 protein [Gammaproteobacteria bacterium]|nr:glycosyltransferase family 2 protein [Gammaproteobacteria bacterium]